MGGDTFHSLLRFLRPGAVALGLAAGLLAGPGPAIDGPVARAAAQSGALQRFPMDQLEIETEKGAKTFTVEIARTPRQHAQGLMYRQSMLPDAGMLFLYSSPQVIRMWMKNTFIPLDMIFIAGNGKIVSIVERAIPESLQTISSGRTASAVLEVNGGTVARLGIRVGDSVRHAAFGTGD